MKKCFLCGHEQYKKRAGKVRDNDLLEILECESCGLVFLSENVITDDYYTKGNMHKNSILQDVSLEYKTFNQQRVSFLRDLLLGKHILDFGSGYGGFLLEAKKIAKSVSGVEIENGVEDIYQKNNIPLYKQISDIKIENLEANYGGGV